ncbi:hypothetical protein NQ318_020943 [Aromia moschata]|uniref:Uncharacterized protein n=1 Tax=Aromia moschata TaxID=1265417 RepID=A0AAV8Y1P1_9CUCU|nr:hypothetical protein NQ318_020943 [Aromia moschata]
MSPEFGFKRGTPPQPLKSHGIGAYCQYQSVFVICKQVKWRMEGVQKHSLEEEAKLDTYT